VDGRGKSDSPVAAAIAGKQDKVDFPLQTARRRVGGKSNKIHTVLMVNSALGSLWRREEGARAALIYDDLFTRDDYVLPIQSPCLLLAFNNSTSVAPLPLTSDALSHDYSFYSVWWIGGWRMDRRGEAQPVRGGNRQKAGKGTWMIAVLGGCAYPSAIDG
jgi:hypothetical protein